MNNLQKAKQFVEELASNQLCHFVDGRRTASIKEKTFDNHSPMDGSVLCKVASADREDIDHAADSATEGFRAWRDVAPRRRREILHRVADLIDQNTERIALLESLDTGQPLLFTGKTASRAADNFRYFADRIGSARDGHAFPTETHINYTVREPLGPIGVITPWNMPFMLATWKIAPALAAGCSVVHKPAEWSPLTASLLAELGLEAGLPAGALNVVHGLGETTGRALTEHSAIKAIAFVGETGTGSRIMAQGAQTLKRVHFELGGKSPVVVFDDANLDRALDSATFMIYSLNGQRCNAGSRLLVQESVHDEFVHRVAKRIRSIKVGDPLDPSTEMGPLIHPKQLARVDGYCSEASSSGAQVDSANLPRELSAEGNWFAPTVVSGVTPRMRIAQEEVFGPVLSVIPFKDEAQALQIANDSRYGLSTYLWTSDVGRAHRMAREFQSGMVWINTEIARHLSTPFGGMRDSGIGRDGGDWSFDFYMETKNICVGLDLHNVPTVGHNVA